MTQTQRALLDVNKKICILSNSIKNPKDYKLIEKMMDELLDEKRILEALVSAETDQIQAAWSKLAPRAQR